MSFNNFIKKIQNKPRSARLLILWTTTALVMVLIIIVWLFSFSRNQGSQKVEENIKQTNLPSLFESLGKDFSIFKDKLDASLKDLNQEVSSQTENLENK